MIRLDRSLFIGAAVLLTASVATPRPTYPAIWSALYPNSQSDDNMLGTGTSCQLCHRQGFGGDGWNGYGWRLRQEYLANGQDITKAMLTVEPENGDADPTLSTNLQEIDSGTQPGWTAGAHNMIWFKTGNTLADQSPPAGILGSLDPSVGDVYCTPDVALDNDLTLVATDLPTNKFGYFLNSQTQGFQAGPGDSQGNLCLGGQIGRYVKQVASTGATGSLALVLDLTNTPTPGGKVSVLAGQTWNFQAWFRDKDPTATSNFTDALSVQFQ